MEFVTIEEVRLQCKADESVDDEMLVIYAEGAEAAAVGFLNRNVYADADALAAAIAGVNMAPVHSAYEDAIAAADGFTSSLDKQDAIDKANITLHSAQLNASMIRDGMVLTPDIKNAVLVIAAFHYRNRDSTPSKSTDPITIPPNAEWLMNRYRKIGPL